MKLQQTHLQHVFPFPRRKKSPLWACRKYDFLSRPPASIAPNSCSRTIKLECRALLSCNVSHIMLPWDLSWTGRSPSLQRKHTLLEFWEDMYCGGVRYYRGIPVFDTQTERCYSDLQQKKLRIPDNNCIHCKSPKQRTHMTIINADLAVFTTMEIGCIHDWSLDWVIWSNGGCWSGTKCGRSGDQVNAVTVIMTRTDTSLPPLSKYCHKYGNARFLLVSEQTKNKIGGDKKLGKKICVKEKVI